MTVALFGVKKERGVEKSRIATQKVTQGAQEHYLFYYATWMVKSDFSTPFFSHE
jgi:hypothetical protein